MRMTLRIFFSCIFSNRCNVLIFFHIVYLNKIDIKYNVNGLRNCDYKFDRVKCLNFIHASSFRYCKHIHNAKEKNMNRSFIRGFNGFFSRSIYWQCIRENMLVFKFYFAKNEANIYMYRNMPVRIGHIFDNKVKFDKIIGPNQEVYIF